MALTQNNVAADDLRLRVTMDGRRGWLWGAAGGSLLLTRWAAPCTPSALCDDPDLHHLRVADQLVGGGGRDPPGACTPEEVLASPLAALPAAHDAAQVRFSPQPKPLADPFPSRLGGGMRRAS